MATTKPKKRKCSSENDDRDHKEPVQSFDTFDGVFSSWEAFQSAFDKYKEDTHQLYKIRSTTSVKDRNRSRPAQTAKWGATADLWGEELGSYAKYFICTHGWEFKPRGKGTRANHRIRSTGCLGCPAKLNANLFKDQDDNTFKVRVTVHNDYVIPSVDPGYKFTPKTLTACKQNDDYNCGVLIVKWFEVFLNVAMHTDATEELQKLTRQRITAKDVDECRYNMFATVFLNACNN